MVHVAFIYTFFSFSFSSIFAFIREESWGGGGHHASKAGCDLCAKMREHRCVVLVNGAILKELLQSVKFQIQISCKTFSDGDIAVMPST